MPPKGAGQDHSAQTGSQGLRTLETILAHWIPGIPIPNDVFGSTEATLPIANGHPGSTQMLLPITNDIVGTAEAILPYQDGEMAFIRRRLSPFEEPAAEATDSAERSLLKGYLAADLGNGLGNERFRLRRRPERNASELCRASPKREPPRKELTVVDDESANNKSSRIGRIVRFFYIAIALMQYILSKSKSYNFGSIYASIRTPLERMSHR